MTPAVELLRSLAIEHRVVTYDHDPDHPSYREEAADAERRTGYVVGGMSPFGQKRPSPTFVDEWATTLDEIHCSGGRRGLALTVSPSAFTRALDATFAPIASWP